MSNELIDVEGLLKRTMDDKEIAKEVLQCYLEETPETLSKLLKAINSRDFKESREKSHEIKGSSASVGALRMQQISEQLQKESEQSNFEMLKSLAVEIEKTYSETEKKINQLEIMK